MVPEGDRTITNVNNKDFAADTECLCVVCLLGGTCPIELQVPRLSCFMLCLLGEDESTYNSRRWPLLAQHLCRRARVEI